MVITSTLLWKAKRSLLLSLAPSGCIAFLLLNGFSTLASSTWDIRRFSPPDRTNFENVYDIEGSEDGSIWFASWGNGVAKLNGTEWRSYSAEVDGLPSNFVASIDYDEVEKRLWIATDEGVAFIQGPNIVSLKIPQDFEPRCVKALSNGELWVGSRYGAIIAISMAEDLDPAAPDWRPILPPEQTDGYVVRDIEQSPDGSLWIARNRSGVLQIHDNQQTFHTSDDIGLFRSDSLFISKTGNVWVSGSDMPAYYDGTEWQSLDLETTINFMTQGPKDRFFLSKSDGGIVDHEGVLIPTNWYPQQLESKITRIYVSDENTLWLGTKEGLLKATRPTWRNLSHASSSPKIQRGHAFFASPTQTPLSLTAGNTLVEYLHTEDRWKPLLSIPGPPSNHQYITRPRSQRSWIRNGDTLYEISLEEKAIRNTVEIPPGFELSAILETDTGNLYIGGIRGGFLWTGRDWIPALGNRAIRAMTVAENGRILIALLNEVELWENDETIQTWFGSNRTKNHPFTFVARGHSESVLVGTLGLGMLIFRKDSETVLGNRNELTSSRITSAFVSSNNDLWVGFETLGVACRRNDRWINYSFEDGFQRRPIIQFGEHPTGTIWAATSDYGIYRYTPDSDPPETWIVNAPSEVEAKNTAVFAFNGYDAWNGTEQAALEYSWRIHNKSIKPEYSSGWSRFATSRSIERTAALKPGRYVFEVKAQDLNFNSDPTSARTEFTVSRAYWKTPQFLTPLTTMFLLAGILGVRLAQSHRNLQKHSKDLDQQVRERTKELTIAYETLSQQKERLDVTLTSIEDAIVATNPDGKIALFNRAAEELVGTKKELALGQPLSAVIQLIENDQPARTEDILVSPEGRSQSGQAKMKTKENSISEIEYSCAPIRDKQTNPVGTVIAIRDRTQQHRLEEELLRTRKLESLGLIAGGIAHDFNNFLTAILCNISVAKDLVSKNSEIKNILSESENASKEATALTQQLLTFAKGGSPALTTEHIGVALQNSVVFSLRGSHSKAEFDISDELWSVDVDLGQFSQVIQNLTVNAQQAMPKGGIVKVTAENQMLATTTNTPPEKNDEPKPFISITISDTGSGIRPADLSTVFDPYFTTKEQGSGLGLSICYSIVKQHNGRISIESEPKTGTTVTIDFPAIAFSDGKSQQPNLTKKHTPSPSKQLNILVMDDEPSILKLLNRILLMANHNCITVDDGTKAIEAYKNAFHQKKPFDVLILDLTVPGGMGGKEALREIRAFDRTAYAIASSGYSEDPKESESAETVFNDYLRKPYTVAEVTGTLTRYQP